MAQCAMFRPALNVVLSLSGGLHAAPRFHQSNGDYALDNT